MSWIAASELIKEWLKPALVEWDDIRIITDSDNRCRIYSKGDQIGITIRIPNAVAIVTLPDSIAGNQKTPWFHPKEFEFDLHHPDSLQAMTSLVVSAIGSFRKYHKASDTMMTDRPAKDLTIQDMDVLVDLLLERLPMVWQDVVAAIDGGEEPEAVLKETYGGHVLRVLRRLGHDVDDWFKELKAYVGVGDGIID